MDFDNVEAFVKLTKQQHYELLINGNSEKIWQLNGDSTIMANLSHSTWWLAALMFEYTWAKQINHSMCSQNTLQYRLNNCVSLLVLLVAPFHLLRYILNSCLFRLWYFISHLFFHLEANPSSYVHFPCVLSITSVVLLYRFPFCLMTSSKSVIVEAMWLYMIIIFWCCIWKFTNLFSIKYSWYR